MSKEETPVLGGRVVLLFDLDCFYAQCERIRLGLKEDASLALLQWNSTLAVTYPARQFGIKRGDSWDAVAKKSNNQCWAIHVLVLQKPNHKKGRACPQDDPPTDADSSHHHQVFDESYHPNSEDSYNRIFRIGKDEQMACQKYENNRRRYNQEGKACLERYRIASVHIFNTVLEVLTKLLGEKNFTLERASIDEFYLDITEYCRITNALHTGPGSREGHEHPESRLPVPNLLELEEHSVYLGLCRGCAVSTAVREEVVRRLGFTISAGISTNKMMAKLAASYGKPNGQAMLHPIRFMSVMQETKIRKVRNFGGKLGHAVTNILRMEGKVRLNADDATMGDLHELSLPVLRGHLSEATASRVFNACRGFDDEEVKETRGALVKSITTFKSFPATSNLSDIKEWVQLMVHEVTERVSRDANQNSRYPKSCDLCYTYYEMIPGGVQPQQTKRASRTLRLTYPSEKRKNKAPLLMDLAITKLEPILRRHGICRLGFAVGNFEYVHMADKGNHSISELLHRGSVHPADTSIRASQNRSDTSSSSLSSSVNPMNAAVAIPRRSSVDSAYLSAISCKEDSSCNEARAKRARLSDLVHEPRGLSEKIKVSAGPNPKEADTEDDLELAKRLQATFDREHYVLSATKRFSQARKEQKTTRTIDQFFLKR